MPQPLAIRLAEVEQFLTDLVSPIDIYNAMNIPNSILEDFNYEVREHIDTVADAKQIVAGL